MVRRGLKWGLGVVAVVVVILLGAGWYLSGLIGCRGFEPVARVQGLEVVAVGAGEITLRSTGEANECGQVSDHWTKAGTFGVTWDGGYGHVGAIRDLNEDGGEVVREFTILEGDLSPGLRTRLTHPYPVDPTRAHGIGFEEIVYDSELGPMSAWLTPGGDDT